MPRLKSTRRFPRAAQIIPSMSYVDALPDEAQTAHTCRRCSSRYLCLDKLDRTQVIQSRTNQIKLMVLVPTSRGPHRGRIQGLANCVRESQLERQLVISPTSSPSLRPRSCAMTRFHSHATITPLCSQAQHPETPIKSFRTLHPMTSLPVSQQPQRRE